MNEYEKQLELHIEILHLEKAKIERDLEKVSEECRQSIKREQENTVAFIRFVMAVTQIMDTKNITRNNGSVYLQIDQGKLVIPEEVYDTIFKPR